jgi:hypothetical protein
MDPTNVAGFGAGIGKVFVDALAKATEDKKTYTEKLEEAKGTKVYKYVLLINVSSLEAYVAQTRIQAEQSFKLSKLVAIVGFGLLSVGVILGIITAFLNIKSGLNAAYLSAIAGVLTEFISGVFFYLYNKTLQQINIFHDSLIEMQKLSMEYISKYTEEQTKETNKGVEALS